MLATKHIKHLNNSLRMTFASSTRTSGSSLMYPAFDVPMIDYISRFDPSRPIYCALENWAGDTLGAVYEVYHLCFDSAYGGGWASSPGLATSIGVTYKQVLSRPITSDTVGMALNGGLLAGGSWQFSIRDMFGALAPDADINLGYSFTLVLFQKSEV
jgi:hypothetical protein